MRRVFENDSGSKNGRRVPANYFHGLPVCFSPRYHKCRACVHNVIMRFKGHVLKITTTMTIINRTYAFIYFRFNLLFQASDRFRRPRRLGRVLVKSNWKPDRVDLIESGRQCGRRIKPFMHSVVKTFDEKVFGPFACSSVLDVMSARPRYSRWPLPFVLTVERI